MKRIKKNKKKHNIFIRLIAAIIYIIYMVIYRFDNLVARTFKKLPRLVKVAIIYTMIVTTALTFKNNASAEVVVPVEEPKEEVVQIVMVDKDVKRCTFNEIECEIYHKALEEGLTHNQALIVIAISKHETGNWTSNLYKNKNNWGGNYNGSKKEFYKFDTKEEGLEYFIRNLKKGYFDKGRNTIEDIGRKYCPVGAKNDPNNINKHWIPQVTEYYNDYLNQ